MRDIKNCSTYDPLGNCKACGDMYKLASGVCKINVVLIIIIILCCLLSLAIVLVSIIIYIKKKKQRIAVNTASKLFNKNNTTLNDTVIKEPGQQVSTMQNEKTVGNQKNDIKSETIPAETKKYIPG